MNIKNTKKIRGVHISSVAAFLLLAAMAVLMFVQAKENTATVDESAHIVSGYAYWTERDYRLNPEHPPLVKMVAATGLLVQETSFPSDRSSWTEEVNGQWAAGDEFLHWEENDPRLITLSSRMGPIIVTILLGLLIFIWAKKLYGEVAGLFALFLFTLSPSFLAHGHLVTTDVGAAFGFLFSTYYFLKYLQDQTTRNLVFTGVAFGVAQLIKFSLILTVPYFIIIIILWITFKNDKKHRPQAPLALWKNSTETAPEQPSLANKKNTPTSGKKRAFMHLAKLGLIFVIGFLIVYPVYQYTVLDYPPERQLSDALHVFGDPPDSTLGKTIAWMADKPGFRAYGQFFFGHYLVFERVTGGNVVYYFGNVSNQAWLSYFPAVFLIKVPLALLLLIAGAIIIILKKALRGMWMTASHSRGVTQKIESMLSLFSKWIDKYFIEIAMLMFIVLYWTISIFSNLNIGIRHVLPTFPFIYILIAGVITKWSFSNSSSSAKSLNPKGIAIVVLLGWYAASSLWAFPHSLAHFNELAGGPSGGHRHVVDSNLDWGQDLGRLVDYVEENNISEIKLDYFGGGNPEYYLEDKYTELDPFSEEQRKGWVAVSATHLQAGRADPAKGYTGSTTHYEWLSNHEPVEVIGHSIFVYYIE